MKKILLVVALLSSIGACDNAKTEAPVISEMEDKKKKSFVELVYGERQRNTLDLYLPDQANPPLVMFVHGGRWFRNDKSQIELFDRRQQLLDAGFAVASVNYTYSNEKVWPAQKEDIELALEYLKSEGKNFGYDSSRFAVWGQSSGAHLALWAGLIASENPELEIDALVSWYAPSNLFELRADRENDDVPGANEREKEPSPESLLIGKYVTENRELADKASPESYIHLMPKSANLSPILLMHGDSDKAVSPLQSIRLRDTILAFKPETDVTLKIVEGAGHGGDEFRPEVSEVIDFLQLHLLPE